eukprot:jgi/Chlat1/8414/Chrsp80S00646
MMIPALLEYSRAQPTAHPSTSSYHSPMQPSSAAHALSSAPTSSSTSLHNRTSLVSRLSSLSSGSDFAIINEQSQRALRVWDRLSVVRQSRVVSSAMRRNDRLPSGKSRVGFFQIAEVGLPAAISGGILLATLGDKLLPDRHTSADVYKNSRQYVIVASVALGGKVEGKTIEKANMRHVPGLFLAQIDRGGGNQPQEEATITPAPGQRPYCRVEISASLRAWWAIADIVLEPGDNLLLVASKNIAKKPARNEDFSLVAGLLHGEEEAAPLAAITVIAMVVCASAADINMLTCAVFAAAILLLIRTITPNETRASISLEVLITITAGTSKAMLNSGSAKLVADGIVAGGLDKNGLIAAVYIVTARMTELVTNNAAVTLMFPIVLEASIKEGYTFVKLVYTLMMAVSASFITPIGYQCKLMVWAPGGYKFTVLSAHRRPATDRPWHLVRCHHLPH